MRILLAHNSLYYPSYGGGDKSNRLLMEALAARGHETRVVSRVEVFGEADGDKLLHELEARGVSTTVIDGGVVHFRRHGVDIHVVTFQANLRPWFSQQIEEFSPHIILTSTDDPGQLLFDLALKSQAHVVYLIRATIAVPFGPDSSAVNPVKAEILRHADGVAGVSRYVANYAREHGQLDAVHVPISLLETPGEFPVLGRFHNSYVSMVNPCAVKGIGIFLELADCFPDVGFAAVPTWGTNPEDYASLTARPNIRVLPPVDDIDELLRITRVMLVPSVWAEARSRIVIEAMSRGVPVISSDAGGIPEAHLGVDYTLPVSLIRSYRPSVDMNMVPVPDVPAQNIAPWAAALRRLVNSEEHWTEISTQSRRAALAYARDLSIGPFETYISGLLDRPKKRPPATGLTGEKRRLLALRLKQRAAAAPKAESLFTGWDDVGPRDLALICFPWAGGGTIHYRRWRDPLRGIAVPVAVQLPGRETRLSESAFGSMDELIAAVGPALEDQLRDRRFAFFGHSMGAGIAFELTRWLRRRGIPLPCALVVSAARAPQYRLNWKPGQDPSDEQLLRQLREMEGIPEEVLGNPEVLELVMPALRADTRLYRHWIYQPDEPLPVPIIAYGGIADRNVTSEHLEVWRDQTTMPFVLRQFRGGHFYLLSPEARMIEFLRTDLAHV